MSLSNSEMHILHPAAPFTGGQVAARVKLLMLSKCFSHETAGEQGEHCSCMEWLQVVSLSDSYFHATQTGTYGCNNKRGRTSFPPVLLNLPEVTLPHCQAHVWRGHVRGTDTQLKQLYQLISLQILHLNLTHSLICFPFDQTESAF